MLIGSSGGRSGSHLYGNAVDIDINIASQALRIVENYFEDASALQACVNNPLSSARVE